MAKSFPGYLLLLLMGFMAPVSADSYVIDVLVFEYTGPDRSGGELWSAEPGPGTMDTRDTGVTRHDIPARLEGTASLLQSHPEYRVLLRKSWIQDSGLKYQVPLIHFDQDPDAVAAGLFGYMRFYRARFLQLETELDFRPGGGSSVVQGSPRSYRLSEKRRVKPRTIHYLDHPRFGAIVAITPRSG